MRHPNPRSRRAFTLLELIVALAVLLVMIGLLLPAVVQVREASRRIGCASNLKQLGLAVHSYHDVYALLPPSRLDPNGTVSWAVLLLPYLEQEDFYRHWDLRRRYYVHPKELRKTDVPVYFCPSRGSRIDDDSHGDFPKDGWPDQISYGGSPSDYAVCAGDNAVSYETPQADGAVVIARYQYAQPYLLGAWASRTSLGCLTDGLSNTLLLGEKHIAYDRYTRTRFGDGSIYNGDHAQVISRVAGPNNPLASSPYEPLNTQFGSAHPGMCQFVFADGSVKALSNRVDGNVLGLLANRADGQPTPDF
jgi:prepilin-type N-terminal cleavage/methylation domain-containing protein/prepilin-type processing-associated H-X9-DG protein